MIKIHKASTRGLTQNEWLTSYHSFSFGDYYDPNNKGYGSLRVINDDYIAAGAGFDPHPHRDMEIITYMISGALEHKDSMDNHFIINAGDVQRMSAGTGITHSEHNHSATEPARLLQLWFHPVAKNLSPSYEQKSFSEKSKSNLFDFTDY
jgi:redox-sensitive bicupin YhaK (pirin superfamily)